LDHPSASERTQVEKHFWHQCRRRVDHDLKNRQQAVEHDDLDQLKSMLDSLSNNNWYKEWHALYPALHDNHGKSASDSRWLDDQFGRQYGYELLRAHYEVAWMLAQARRFTEAQVFLDMCTQDFAEHYIKTNRNLQTAITTFRDDLELYKLQQDADILLVWGFVNSGKPPELKSLLVGEGMAALADRRVEVVVRLRTQREPATKTVPRGALRLIFAIPRIDQQSLDSGDVSLQLRIWADSGRRAPLLESDWEAWPIDPQPTVVQLHGHKRQGRWAELKISRPAKVGPELQPVDKVFGDVPG
jgi:hypothetical protein